MSITRRKKYDIYFFIFLFCISLMTLLPRFLNQKPSIYFIIIVSICELLSDLLIAKLASIFIIKKFTVKQEGYIRLYRVDMEEFYDVMIWIILIIGYSLKLALFHIDQEIQFHTYYLFYLMIFINSMLLLNSTQNTLYINNQYLLFQKNMKISLKDIKSIDKINSSQARVITDNKTYTIHAIDDNMQRIKDRIKLNIQST